MQQIIFLPLESWTNTQVLFFGGASISSSIETCEMLTTLDLHASRYELDFLCSMVQTEEVS